MGLANAVVMEKGSSSESSKCLFGVTRLRLWSPARKCGSHRRPRLRIGNKAKHCAGLGPSRLRFGRSRSLSFGRRTLRKGPLLGIHRSLLASFSSLRLEYNSISTGEMKPAKPLRESCLMSQILGCSGFMALSLLWHLPSAWLGLLDLVRKEPR